MTLKTLFAAMVLILALSSCEGPVENNSTEAKTSIIGLFEESNTIDSLVILYFTDTVKFRYYTFTQTVKKEDLTAFKENLETSATHDSACVKDGTIYGYIKGQIYTTLYFNMTDSCRSLRLFKNGTLYSYPISNSFLERLRAMKAQSVNP